MQRTPYPPRLTAHITDASSLEPGIRAGSAGSFSLPEPSQEREPRRQKTGRSTIPFAPPDQSKLIPNSESLSHDAKRPREQRHLSSVESPTCAPHNAPNVQKKQHLTSKGRAPPSSASDQFALSSYSISIKKQLLSDKSMGDSGKAGIPEKWHSDDVSLGSKDVGVKEGHQGGLTFW